MVRGLLLFAALALISEAHAQPATPPLERCGVMVESASGLNLTVVPGFSVQTAELPLRVPDGYENVRSIMCGRPSLFIADNDYRVITDLSMTLGITDGDRVLALEMSAGQFRARMIEGEMTESEAEAVMVALNRAQSLIQEDGPS